jgi:hypothetical protein
MWHRFTTKARNAILRAQEEAQRLGSGHVATEHLLLGLLSDPETVAAIVLEKLGAPLDKLRAATESQLTVGQAGDQTEELSLTPRVKRVIDLAYDEARNLSNDYVGTEHLLLGLVREYDGVAGLVLARLGVTLEAARRVVMVLQDQYGLETPGATRSESTEEHRAAIRSKLVFLLADEPERPEIEELLRSVGLVPLDWNQAVEFTGKSQPTLSEEVGTALSVGGAILFVLGHRLTPDRFFAAGLAAAAGRHRTILVAADEVVLGSALGPHLVRLDGSDHARQKVVEALQAAGCPVDTVGS